MDFLGKKEPLRECIGPKSYFGDQEFFEKPFRSRICSVRCVSAEVKAYKLDIDVSEDLFTNPVQHVTGYESIAPDDATATLTYSW